MNKINTQQQQSPQDHVQGFLLKASGIRGRVVRLTGALDAIIHRHNYPESVAGLLAEALSLTVALAYALKYEGVFTLQTKGDGPVNMLVADVTKEGAMRAYAHYDEEKLAHAGVGSALLLGKGHLAFTVDVANDRFPGADKYQGIVELIGRDMATIVQNYFRQSEQIDTAFHVSAGKDANGKWQAGVIMIQRVPEGGGYAANSNLQEGDETSEERAENWQRASLFMNTVTSAELFDATLSTPDLLHRLFHEEQLELGERHDLRDQCRCSRQRVAMVLSTIPSSEIMDLMKDGKVEVKCEFCSTTYDFNSEEISQLEAGPGVR